MRWNAGGNERARGRRTLEREKDRSTHRAREGCRRVAGEDPGVWTSSGPSARRRVEILSIGRVYAEISVAISVEIGELVD